ncbi:MAG: flagellin [Planctomycetota bacterium]
MSRVFFPIYGGRSSNPQMSARGLYQIQTARNGIEQLQTQLSTGRRLLTPSDEPDTAVRALQVQREKEFRTQALRNLNSTESYLNTTESTLATIQDTVNQLRGLTVGAATNLVSDSERLGLISQIDSAMNVLIGKANAKFQDRYLFSGASTGAPTVSQTGTAVRFLGDEKDLLTISDLGQVIPNNVTGQRAMGLMSTGVVSTVDFAPAAIPETNLADLNGGKGVGLGAIKFTDGLEEVSVDLASTSRVKDVLDLINGRVRLSGRDVSISLQTNGTLQVQYADGGPGILRVSDVGVGRAAADLGIATTVPAPILPITSPSLDPILKLNTKLSQFNDGAGFDQSEGFRIQQGGRTYTILIGASQTIEDVFNEVRRSGASIIPEITPDGRNIRFRSTESGTDFSIGEIGGLLETRLVLRTLTEATRVDQLNYARGLSSTTGAEFAIRRNNGSQFSVDLTGSVTVQDILDRVNNNVANQDPATKVTAFLNSVGNGITLSSVLPAPGAPDPQPIAIFALNGAETAWELGWIPAGQSSAVGSVTATDSQLVGADPNPQEVRGIFNSLLRFREAVRVADPAMVARASQLFEEDASRLSSSRGSLGISLQQIDDLTQNHEDRTTDLTKRESQLIDADLAATITEITGRQTAYQASLQLLSSNNRLNLFDFL